MKYAQKYILALIVLTASLYGYEARSQRIVSVNVDSVACMNDSVNVSIGIMNAREVVVRGGETTLSHPEVTFLPDGVECNGNCSYHSPVTFTDFAPNAHISSVQDIRYVRLNIEHSYIGDIYIAITCPNGQTASLMNYGGSGTSPCNSTIQSDHRGWSTAFSNAGTGSDFGQPNLNDSGNKCNTSTNPPGTGWNYCWSNNTTSGYQYAGQDALIYRSINAHNDRIDSSNVAAGTNFYHPNQNFSSLIGCPLNGEWYIEVIDGWGVDNGYIFDWELSLDPSLMPTGDDIDLRIVTGDEVTTVNDSTYIVSAPTGMGIYGDTTVTYNVHVTTTHGNVMDTTFTVHYVPLFHTVVDQILCQGDTAWWDNVPYTSDTVVQMNLHSVHGCDSVIDLQYRFNPAYEVGDTSRLCPGSLFEYEGIDFGGPIDFDSPHLTVDGCDSLVHVSLILLDSAFHAAMLISDDNVHWSSDTTLLGCKPYTVLMRDTTPLVAQRLWLTGDGDTILQDSLATHIYDTAGVFSIGLKVVSVNGCEDSIFRKNAVWVFEQPKAEFVWDLPIPGNHRAEAQFYNLSTIGDSNWWPAGSHPLTYLWEFDSGSGTDTTTEHSPFYHWGEPQNNMAGDYNVRLIAFWLHEGPDSLTTVCADTVEHQITIANVFLQFPNLVTPNGDGINDTWIVVNLLEYGLYSMNEVWIYDAWGALIYHKSNIRQMSDFWDPNETHSPDGTYFFRFSGKGDYGLIRRNGMIEVVR